MTLLTHSAPTPRDLAVMNALRVHRRMTAEQLRRLLFRRSDGECVAPQTVHGRLRRLIDLGYLDAVKVDRGRGSGPNAYGLVSRGRAVIGAPARRSRPPGPIWHDLQVAELRVCLENDLSANAGELVEWVGEGDLRGILRGSSAPRPDGLCHWRLDAFEGVVLFEVDTGSEPFAALPAKLRAYERWFRSGAHREVVPGLPLRPRVAVIAPHRRAARLVNQVRSVRSLAMTVLVGVDSDVLSHPLTARWWRSDIRDIGWFG